MAARGAGIASALLALLLLGALLLVEDAREVALALLEWIERQGPAGMAIFFALYVGAVLLLLPGVVLTLGGGFLFGFWTGSALVVGSLAVGSALAFQIARHLMGERLAKRIAERPSLRAANRGIERDGWKLVALTRCLPGFPYKLSNYFFGLTAISFQAFFWSNLLGVIPLSLLNVSIGAAAADVAELTRLERPPWQWALYAVGFLVALMLVAALGRIARRVAREARLEDKDETSS